MGASDGRVLAFTQLMNNGSRKLRYNLVLTSEGYTEAEMPLFRAQCTSLLRLLYFTAPFSDFRCTFNVFALEVSSTQSGIKDPLVCGDGTRGTGASPATFFDASMCGDGDIRRIVSFDTGLARNRISGFIPEWNAILVLVNSSLKGATAYDDVAVAVVSTELGWEYTALHEFGHVFGLADEYTYDAGPLIDGGRTYPAAAAFALDGQLGEPNVTSHSRRGGLKWGHLVAATTRVPTWPGTVPKGTVGLFEGARYYAFGLYRPEEECRMDFRLREFCAVCRATIRSALAHYTPNTTCAFPMAPSPVVTLRARIGRKMMIGAGRGAYEVQLTATTGLPVNAKWSYHLDSEIPTASPTIVVPINDYPTTYVFHHSVGAQATIAPADLPYWVPTTPEFTTPETHIGVDLRQPHPEDNRVQSDYDDPGNVSSTVATALKSGSAAIYVGGRKHYKMLAARLILDGGYFGPDDDPAWLPKSIAWSPAPSTTTGMLAYYDITFDANGRCWLNSDPGTVVDPNIGFPIAVSGRDAIGQPFDATGRLVPTNVEYRQSISTIQYSAIPELEWPFLIESPETIVSFTVSGTQFVLEGDVLRIGDYEIQVPDTPE